MMPRCCASSPGPTTCPAELIAQFTKETGIQVQVTLSNNEEMISKLRATGGAGFDLAQPSQDRIVEAQQEFRIYKPIDVSKVRLEQFMPELLETMKKNTTVDGKLYGLPYVWGTEGLVYNSKRTKIADYTDLCRPDLKGSTAVRLKRPTLMAFAFAAGKDPFALYNNPKAYSALMDQVGKTLIACKPNLRFFYDNKDQLLNGVRAGRDRSAHDVGLRRLEAQPREPGHPVHQPALRCARLDRHVRAAGAGPQRRRRLCLDQLQHARARSPPRSRRPSATSPPPRAPTSLPSRACARSSPRPSRTG